MALQIGFPPSLWGKWTHKDIMINELLTTCIYTLIYNDICIVNGYRLDTYRTGEYIPLSQGGIRSLISLFTMESSPNKADVFTFMFRAPLKALPSQFLHRILNNQWQCQSRAWILLNLIQDKFDDFVNFTPTNLMTRFKDIIWIWKFLEEKNVLLKSKSIHATNQHWQNC